MLVFIGLITPAFASQTLDALVSVKRSKYNPYGLIEGQLSAAHVSTLTSFCFPFTVPGLIVAIVVNPFNRPSFARTRSHKRKECFEVITPILANGDASASVIFPL